MSKPEELQKIPLESEALPTVRAPSLPFSTVPVAGGVKRRKTKDASEEFKAYLDQQDILKLPRYVCDEFDAAAEVLRDSVYRPIELKR